MTSQDFVTSIVVILALLSALAWMKSAHLQARGNRPINWLDAQLNRISREPNVWNAIAAALASFVAIAQAVLYLLSTRR